MRNFVGKTAYVCVSDPWEFCTAHGPGPFVSTIVTQEGDEYLLVKLDAPIAWRDVDILMLVAATRHAGVSFARLVYGATVACDFLGLSNDEALEHGLENVSATDGPMLLGTIHLKGGVLNMIR